VKLGFGVGSCPACLLRTLHFRLSVNRLDTVAPDICTTAVVPPAMLAPWRVTIVLMVATDWARSVKQGSRYQGKFVCVCVVCVLCCVGCGVVLCVSVCVCVRVRALANLLQNFGTLRITSEHLYLCSF
jgi:hypothetical protein